MHAIRLIGQNHTTHHEGEVLSIVDERTAMTNRNTVTLEHAHVLVGRGEAEWIGMPPDIFAEIARKHVYEEGTREEPKAVLKPGHVNWIGGPPEKPDEDNEDDDEADGEDDDLPSASDVRGILRENNG